MKIKSSLPESDNVEFNLSLLKKRNDKRFIHFEVLYRSKFYSIDKKIIRIE